MVSRPSRGLPDAAADAGRAGTADPCGCAGTAAEEAAGEATEEAAGVVEADADADADESGFSEGTAGKGTDEEGEGDEEGDGDGEGERGGVRGCGAGWGDGDGDIRLVTVAVPRCGPPGLTGPTIPVCPDPAGAACLGTTPGFAGAPAGRGCRASPARAARRPGRNGISCGSLETIMRRRRSISDTVSRVAGS